MTAYRSFAHALDEELSQAPETPPSGAGAEARVATPAIWDIPVQACRLAAHIRTSWVHASHASQASQASVASKARTPAPRTSLSHRLTTTQRSALQQLRQLGADLDPTFSERQLRAAFRALAKRFHPDRHPGSSPAEQERLAWTFATVREAYRELTGLFGQANPAAHR